MYPVLFQIGWLRVETYYVLWLAALSIAMFWTVRRFAIYEIDDDEARRVIGWAFWAMLIGARAFEYAWNFEQYWQNPSLFLDLNHGGLSETGAFLGAFLAAFFMCFRNPKLTFSKLCDVVTLPAFLTMAVGRWGCFFSGCCTGIYSSCPLALHFPYDPAGITRHPTQLYYSAASFLILCVLLLAEHFILRHVHRYKGGIIVSSGLILYTIMRFSISLLRESSHYPGLALSNIVNFSALLMAFVWLLISIRSFRKEINS